MNAVDPVAEPEPADATRLRYLEPAELTFSRSAGGVLRLTLPDRSHRQVSVARTRPLTAPEIYLSVLDGEKEIGLIRDLTELPPEQQELVRAELDRRYFQPVVRKVVELRDSHGAYHWEVETDRGHASFDTQHPRHAVTRLEGGRWLIRASDQNRYEIRDLDAMDLRSRKLLFEILL